MSEYLVRLKKALAALSGVPSLASSALRTSMPQRMRDARDILSGVDCSDHHKVTFLIQDIEEFLKEWERQERPETNFGQGPVQLSEQMPVFCPGSYLGQKAEDIVNSLLGMAREQESFERQSPATSPEIKGFGEGVKDRPRKGDSGFGDAEG